MANADFSLRSFQAAPFEVSGNVERVTDQIRVIYRVRDSFSKLKYAKQSSSPRRRHELWKTTCFELFISAPSEKAYWEVNVAASGDWNVYRFDSYREGMVEEERFQDLKSSISAQSDSLEFVLEFDLSTLSFKGPIEMAVAGVMQESRGGYHYFALQHLQKKPDFHDRKTFGIKLD